ncbi:NAD(P)H-dependent oxidoreductase [Acidisoma cellulosilytica]|uniref:NAD(P)H-dependent oxidoreductase n=1 Tax=Acidisoma cellulosilyticum TaxID=2802395 RepID=A0A963Z2E8_9PROT|nr:NAD(P)H-dependent oxidoreductase [Acidisoma cellulosilyticum]MCB8881602.1 NAD(P)H-dependent oxidoreductase [Acidisoma cellulosilyticum]
MKVLVLYAHPVETSFNAAVHQAALKGLRRAGHTIDNCDLYAEGFQPVLTRAERLAYHDSPANRAPVADYVARLQAAEALVIVSPVWNFGFPAILKGYFDRVFLPGVSFDMVDGKVATMLHNIGKLTACLTYGGNRTRAFLAGDPPRKMVTRVLRVTIKPGATVEHLAFYDMNRATEAQLTAHLARVERRISAF